MLDFPVNHLLVLLDYLPTLNPIVARKDFMDPSCLRVVMDGLMQIMVHELIQTPNPTFFQHRSEQALICWVFECLISEELFEYAMCFQRLVSLEGNIIICASFALTGQGIISLTGLNELGLGLLILRIFLGMILESQLSVCMLNLCKVSLLCNTQHTIEILDNMRIILLKEFLLLLILNTKLIIEAFKCIFSLFQWKLHLCQVVIMCLFALVSQHLICLTDVFELLVSRDSALLVLFGM